MYHPLCTRTSRGNRALQCVGAPCCTSRTHARRGARARAANVSKLHRRFRCAGGLLCAACVRTDAPMTLSDPFHSVPSTEWPSLAYLWPSLKVPSSELKPVLRCWLLLLPRATRESIAERPCALADVVCSVLVVSCVLLVVCLTQDSSLMRHGETPSALRARA